MGGMISSTWAPSSREWRPDRDLKRLLIRRTEPEKGIQAEATNSPCQVPTGNTTLVARTHRGRCWKVASGLRGCHRLLRLRLQEALVEEAGVLFDARHHEAGRA